MTKEESRAYHIAYFLKNSEKLREKHRLYWKETASVRRAQKAEYYKRVKGLVAMKCKTDRVRFSAYKSASKRRGIFFSLSFEQFMGMWKNPCRYCGRPIEYIGIDRVDNSVGYVIGNVVPCCAMCNMAKRDMSVCDFINMCRLVVENNSKNTI